MRRQHTNERPRHVGARSSALTALALVAAVTAAPSSAQEPVQTVGPCGAVAEHPGGEWRSYGHDLRNSRHQPHEDRIGFDTVIDLAPAWVFPDDLPDGLPSSDTIGQPGSAMNSTPIVADGCVYLTRSTGEVTALNADTGEVTWSVELDAEPPAYGGGIVGAPGIHGDQLLVLVNQRGTPYVASLDRATGELQWRTVIEESDGAMTNASVVVHDGLVLAGFGGQSAPTGQDPDPGSGGFATVDAETGELLAVAYTIPEAEVEMGYGGASIWSTAAVDEATDHAYVGTGNPHSLDREHEHSNALIKVDVDRDRDTFGQIVGAYKGQRDSYVDGLDRQPVCEHLGGELRYPIFGWSLGCGQLDLDFGASPNLITDERGQTQVGALQKSGVFHTVGADTMSRAWTTVIGAPCFSCNAASSAYDGDAVYAAAAPPGQMVALDGHTGAYEWLSPIGDVVHYQSVSSANGVVYTIDGFGTLNAYDTGTGMLAKLPTLVDIQQNTVNPESSAGVAIARNTLYAPVGDRLVAYRLP